MKLTEQFKQDVQQHQWFSKEDTLVVGVSTGVDSMALLALLQSLPDDLRPTLVVAHVNHQLRTQSNREETYLRDYCNRANLALEVKTWPKSQHPESGMENAARQFRYQFFRDVMTAHHANVLVTAHHADDQAETVLMKLTRGGEVSQLRGILPVQPFQSGRLIRPLLKISKAQLKDFAKQRQLVWFEDETNQFDDVYRNRIRHHVLPIMKAENHQVLAQISAMTDQLSDLISLADQQSTVLVHQVAVPDNVWTNSLKKWYELQPMEQRAVLVAHVKHRHLPINRQTVAEMRQLLLNKQKPTGQIQLPTGLALVKRTNQFLIGEPLKVAENGAVHNEIVVLSNQWVSISSRWAIRLVETSEPHFSDPCRMAISLTADQLPLKVRHPIAGDTLRLKSGHDKLIRRILIDHKVPVDERPLQWVVVDATGHVLWLIGIQRRATMMTALHTNYELIIKSITRGADV